jgi:putative NADH-flavin reductase
LRALAAEADTEALDLADDGCGLAALVAAHDATVSAVRPPAGRESDLVGMTRAALEAARASGRPLYVTGGAAPLKLGDGSGHTVLTAPDFLPEGVRPIAEACQAQDALLEEFPETAWTCLRPAAQLVNAERTGRYALGRDRLVTQADGRSRISYADFAVAMLDLVDLRPAPRQRLTVGW